MSNAPIVKEVVKPVRKAVGEVTSAVGLTSKPSAAPRTAAKPSAAETAADTRMMREDRAEAALASGQLRARRGRAGGYRSLLSSERMAGMAKGVKSTLGG